MKQNHRTLTTAKFH